MLSRIPIYISDLIWSSHHQPVVDIILFNLQLRKWRLRIKWLTRNYFLVKNKLKFKLVLSYSKTHHISTLFCCLNEPLLVLVTGKYLMFPLSVDIGEEEVRSHAIREEEKLPHLTRNSWSSLPQLWESFMVKLPWGIQIYSLTPWEQPC